MRSEILLLGLGNELFTDEGIGIVASRSLAERNLPGVEVLDGGTLGVSLLPAIAGRQALLVLDAVVANGVQPGEVVVYQEKQIRRESRLLYSAHQLGITEVLAAADLAGSAPGRLAAVGMAPASVDTGYGPSPIAIKALPEMVEAAMEILRRWGIREPANA